MPLPAMLVPLAGFAKGLTGLGVGKAAAGASTLVPKSIAAARMAPGAGAFAKGAAAKRFAGDALKNTGKFFLENAGRNKAEVALRLALTWIRLISRCNNTR